MAEDVSNKTVLVLVILTILISTLGTFTVTSSVRQYNADQVPVYGESSPVQSGKVSLSLNSPDVGDSEPVASSVTGNVIFVPVSNND